MNFSFILFLLGMCVTKTFAQVNAKIICKDNPGITSKIKCPDRYPNAENLQNDFPRILSMMQEKGYLLANVDSFKQEQNIVYVYLNSGLQYKWGKLIIDPKDELLFTASGLSEKMYQTKVFSPRLFAKLHLSLLDYLENNGYPFASIKFDSIKIENDGISAKLSIQKNNFITIDSIIQLPSKVVKETFLENYLEIKQGMPYSEQKNRQLSYKLKQLPFLKETKNPVLRITDKTTKLYLFPAIKNASQFDGIIGLLPDGKGKTILTGDVKIKLYNSILKSGELVELNFRRLTIQTQDLFLKINYPYLFSAPIGTEYSLKIYRKDSTFIDVNNFVCLQYLFKGLNHLKLFFKQRNSALISTKSFENTSITPDFADMRTVNYGLGCFIEQLDYKFNPRKGISINMNVSAGNRKVIQNPRINQLAYHQLDLLSVQYQGEFLGAIYFPIKQRSCLKINVQAASIFAKRLFKNELLRIGGFKTLRGFDEESIFANTYIIPTLEYRFLFEENSALYLFTEGAWYEERISFQKIKDKPFSVGAGINFETKAGVFSLNYAVGKQLSNPFDIRAGKIHFGIINTF